MPRAVPIDAIRPSQLYLNSAKLAAVIDRFDFDDPEYGPLPVLEHDGNLYLSDGHTRAFVAYLSGAEELRVVRDETDFEREDRLLYRECFEWCDDAGITRIHDLADRVVSPETYEKKWIGRCHRAGERLGDG